MFHWRLRSSRPTVLTHARKPQGEQRWHADPGPQMTPICPTGTLDESCWWHDGWRGLCCGRGGCSCRRCRAVPGRWGPVLGGSHGGSGEQQLAPRGTAVHHLHEGTFTDGHAATDGLGCLRATLPQQSFDNDSYCSNDKLWFSYAVNYPQLCLLIQSSSGFAAPQTSSFSEESKWL